MWQQKAGRTDKESDRKVTIDAEYQSDGIIWNNVTKAI